MSNNTNEALLETVSDAIQLAADYQQEFLSTYIDKDLERAVDALSEAIDAGNLDDVYGIYLPTLQRKLDDCSIILAQESQSYFGEQTDVY